MVASDVPDMFKAIEAALPLLGPMEHVRRAMAHALIGAVLRCPLQCMNMFTDTRISLAVAIEAGRGKREIERTMRLFARDVGLSYAKPASRHVEQLVGQVITFGKGAARKTRIEPGYCAQDLLMINEAYGEVNDPANRGFRSVLSLALDPMGHNELQKKRLKDLRPLAYEPQVTVVVMFQPQPILAEAWYSGFARRFLWVVMPELDDAARAYIRTASWAAERPAMSPELLFKFRDFAAATRVPVQEPEPEDDEDDAPAAPTKPADLSFTFTDQAKQAMQGGWEELVKLATEEDSSLRRGGLVTTLEFDLRDQLAKMASHYAFARKFEEWDWRSEPGQSAVVGAFFRHIPITESDVKLAEVDMQRFVHDSIHFLSRWVNAEIDLTRLPRRQQSAVVLIAKHGPLGTARVAELMDLYGQPQSRPDELQADLVTLEVMGYIHRTMDGVWEAGW